MKKSVWLLSLILASVLFTSAVSADDGEIGKPHSTSDYGNEKD